MVVDPQTDAVKKAHVLGGEHTGGSNVGADEKGILRGSIHRQALQKKGKPGGDLRVSEHPGGFPEKPESPAQSGGRCSGPHTCPWVA